MTTLDGALVTTKSVRSYVGSETRYNLIVEAIHSYFVMVGPAPVLVHNCSPSAFNGASLDHLSAADVSKVQATADRIGKPVHVVGSRATGKAGPESDWDYVVTGANSKVKDKIKWMVPSGARTGQGKGLDIFTGSVNDELPYITFHSKGLCGCK